MFRLLDPWLNRSRNTNVSFVHAPYDAHFPLRRTACFTVSSTDSFTVASTAVVSLDKYFRRVYVSMSLVAALSAVVSLALTAGLVYILALSAGLTGVSSRDEFDTTANGFDLIADHGYQSAPASVINLARQLSFAHTSHVQVFNDHHPERLCVPSRQLVQDMRSLPSDLPVDLSDTLFCLIAPLRPSLTSRGNPLHACQFLMHLLPMFRIRHNATTTHKRNT
jgi:hypothetical protein